MFRSLCVAVAVALAGCQPVAPSDALTACIDAGRVPEWRSSNSASSFRCEPATVPAKMPAARAPRKLLV